jgi:hypothetical protein
MSMLKATDMAILSSSYGASISTANVRTQDMFPHQQTFADVVRPMKQLARFFLREPDTYMVALRHFRPERFPRALADMATVL